MAQWIVDHEYSRALFTVRYLLFARLSGEFDRITGTADFDPDDPVHLSIEVAIDVTSINTGNQERDDYLRGPDFFDARKYPAITFTSTSIEMAGSNRAKITGDLTIHGTTHTVVLDTEHSGPGDDAYGDETHMQFTARTVIDREDYGIVLGGAAEVADGWISREINITLDVRLVLQDQLEARR